MKNIITIDVYSDTICPWCYIGFNVLEEVKKNFTNISFKIVWRPFQLNPKMPLEGMERNKYLESKFSGKNGVKKNYNLIYQTGLKHNIHFQFNKILLTPNSFYSHKLLALAYEANIQTEVLETLFYNYFIEGINIGKLEELTRIAKQHKIYSINTLEYLKSDKDNNHLLEEENHARELGIQGVPCFIFNKKYVIFGVQSKKEFIAVIKNISNEF